MKKLMFVFMSTGYCGSDGHDVFDATGMTEEQIQDAAYEMAVQHAESYGIYPRDYYEDEDSEYDEENEDYVDSIEGSAVPYVPEKHDQLRAGGGSFMEEYPE